MMNNDEFEQFVTDNGKQILNFCRMTCGDKESGDELYQDTMLKLLHKKHKLDCQQNVRSYALSISLLLWKNIKKKYANRNRLLSFESIDKMKDDDHFEITDTAAVSPETYYLRDDEKKTVQMVVARLPEKFRIPIYLYYSAEISIQEIAEILNVPAGTVKSRMNKAKHLLKEELEELGYDR